MDKSASPGLFELSNPKYQILGKGWFGIVIRPPISCGNFSDNNDMYVGKIAVEHELKTEYDFIQKLVEIDTEYSKLVKGKVKLCSFEEENIPKSLVKDIHNYVVKFPVYQLTMPYLGKTFCDFLDPYKKICKIQCKIVVDSTSDAINLRILDVITCKKIIVAFQKLYADIHNYNTSGIFHNDIKPDNLIYNVERNVLILIDFNASINKQIVDQYVHNVKSYQEILDKYAFIKRVVLYFFQIALNNQTIYDGIYDLYADLIKYIKNVTSKIKPHIELHQDDFARITANFDEKLANLFDCISKMDENNDKDIDPKNVGFCSLDNMNVHSVEEQRKNAIIYSEHAKNITRENRDMGSQDKRGGKKTRKKRNNKNKRKSYCRRSRV